MRIILFLGLFLASDKLLARPVARVLEVHGSAFAFQGKSPMILKYGDELGDMSDIMVEDGGALSLVTTDDKVIHISSGSFVKLYDGLLALKNGHIWLESNNGAKGIVNTSNSIAHYTQGQFIYSFDNISGKTQILVLEGDIKFSNSLEPNLATMVTAGYFSLVDQKYENGLPRTPTRVGLNSYKETKQVFANVKALESSKFEESIWGEKKGSKKRAMPMRKIASVSHQSNSQKGKLIFVRTIQTERSPASLESPLNYYLKMKKRDTDRRRPLKTSKVARIKYYGLSKKTGGHKMKSSSPSSKAKAPARLPASIQKNNLMRELKQSRFEKSLQQQLPKNRRNSDEVNGLIDELKTYNQDFKKKF